MTDAEKYQDPLQEVKGLRNRVSGRFTRAKLERAEDISPQLRSGSRYPAEDGIWALYEGTYEFHTVVKIWHAVLRW